MVRGSMVNRRNKPSRPATRPAPAGKTPGGAPEPGLTLFDTRLFDARPDRVDFRDVAYRPALRSLPPRYPSTGYLDKWLTTYVAAGLILDQGTEGACTGFGLACVVNYLLFVRAIEAKSTDGFEPVSPRMLYELARRYDEWRGDDYEGSSCRGALKGWHKHGVCSEKLWPYPFDRDGKAVFVRPNKGWEEDSVTRPLGVYYRVDRASVVDLQAAVAEIGAIYVSAKVHEGWDVLTRTRATAPPRRHADIPLIPAPKNSRRTGGHAFAIVGYDERGFIVQNSWGRRWGAGGFGVLGYEDWTRHATDAWTCALGVPVTVGKDRLAATRWPGRSGWSLNSFERTTRSPDNPPDDPWPVDHSFDTKAYQPLSTSGAYERTLVTGNDGRICVRDLTRQGAADAEAYADDILVTKPLEWFAGQPGSKAKIAIYAHGGLNSEQESIARIRVLAPYFLANGVYPIFLTWRTGLDETLFSAVEDWGRRIPGAEEERAAGLGEWLEDQKDRAIEGLGRLFGRGIWSEMRENAARGVRPGHGLDAVARKLVALSGKLGGKALELHLAGHSAGAIMLGHLLERLCGPDLAAAAPRVRTATLFAPACSSRFAVARYLAAAEKGILAPDRLWLYVLSDENEKLDALPSPGLAVYGKSLLYLVSRALDDVRCMPLLGMERALLSRYAYTGSREATDQWDAEEIPFVKQWLAKWKPNAGGNRLLTIVTEHRVRDTRADDFVQATHGSFDNNIPVLTDTIERIAGKKLVAPMEWLDY
ncbi:MAG: peptidase C1 [Burkholderiales bacterium]|nr:peptidase C1 [Burkholderiales bacterium]